MLSLAHFTFLYKRVEVKGKSCNLVMIEEN